MQAQTSEILLDKSILMCVEQVTEILKQVIEILKQVSPFS